MNFKTASGREEKGIKVYYMVNDRININDYDYELPEDRIAQYPVAQRDSSKLLVVRKDNIGQDVFSNIDKYIPAGSLLVFNNSKVIKARLLFGKTTGARIEVFCLEPLSPAGYEQSLQSIGPVEWKCIIGNLKKWKSGTISSSYTFKGQPGTISAEIAGPCEGESWRIRFTWNTDTSFSEVLESAGHMPLPPYISRPDEPSDSVAYQTVYSRIRGSVAAPTAGLHFTDTVLKKLHDKAVAMAEVTLHVGAGTFQPVKAMYAREHEMHSEHFTISSETLQHLIKNTGRILAVGTTSVRTLESLYWFGVKVINSQVDKNSSLYLKQWEAYSLPTEIPVNEALNALLLHMEKKKSLSLSASTSIMIVPGYRFRVTNGIVTNFHQPRSTLLLLVSAWIGVRWREAYEFALENDFRFLSYGDSSIMIP